MSDFIQLGDNVVVRKNAITHITKNLDCPDGAYYGVHLNNDKVVCVGISSLSIKWLDELFNEGVNELVNFIKATKTYTDEQI